MWPFFRSALNVIRNVAVPENKVRSFLRRSTQQRLLYPIGLDLECFEAPTVIASPRTSSALATGSKVQSQRWNCFFVGLIGLFGLPFCTYCLALLIVARSPTGARVYDRVVRNLWLQNFRCSFFPYETLDGSACTIFSICYSNFECRPNTLLHTAAIFFNWRSFALAFWAHAAWTLFFGLDSNLAVFACSCFSLIFCVFGLSCFLLAAAASAYWTLYALARNYTATRSGAPSLRWRTIGFFPGIVLLRVDAVRPFAADVSIWLFTSSPRCNVDCRKPRLTRWPPRKSSRFSRYFRSLKFPWTISYGFNHACSLDSYCFHVIRKQLFLFLDCFFSINPDKTWEHPQRRQLFGCCPLPPCRAGCHGTCIRICIFSRRNT